MFSFLAFPVSCAGNYYGISHDFRTLRSLHLSFSSAFPVIFPVSGEAAAGRPVWEDCVRHQEVRASEGGRRLPRVL
jgi:hypothetical protein